MTQLTDFMQTPIFGCSPRDTLANAARQMEEHNVGSLVVTDTQERIIGLLTDRDIALAIGRGSTPDTNVDKISTHSVVTIGGDADITEAAAVMQSEGVWRLPVADDGGRPLGMVSLNDLFGCVAEETLSVSQAAHAHGLPKS